MPDTYMDVKVEGIEELQAKLRDPRMLQKPLKELLTEGASIGRKASEMAIDGGTGIAVRSIGATVYPTQARVWTALPKARAQSIDVGRKVGERVPLGQLIRWKEAEGIGASAVELQQQIKRRGTKGKRFIEAAKEAVNNAMPRLMKEMSDKIARWWGK